MDLEKARRIAWMYAESANNFFKAAHLADSFTMREMRRNEGRQYLEFANLIRDLCDEVERLELFAEKVSDKYTVRINTLCRTIEKLKEEALLALTALVDIGGRDE